MRDKIQAKMQQLIEKYCEENNMESMWREPVIKYADAHSPLFDKLREIIDPDHHYPTDYLPEATLVLSYFMPFKKEIMDSNTTGELTSPEWAAAYGATNTIAGYLNEKISEYIKELGYDACPPTDLGIVRAEQLRSRWSQRHVGYIAGQGTFGINNMLISDKGCAGRYYTVITTLPFEADAVVEEERCLYKKDGSCRLCVERCPVNALQESGFVSYDCLDQCNKNEDIYGHGACGKCAAGMPCSYKE